MQSNDVNAAAVDDKEAEYFGVPWEDAYGYAQAIKVGDTIHVFGQLSHEEKVHLIAPASLDDSGKPAEFSMMEQQMRATHANAVKLLARFGATLNNVVEETLSRSSMSTPHLPPRERCAGRPTVRHDVSAPAT
jgi:enamine deaminase RidA (YjgF/YER057c/UK114 family)